MSTETPTPASLPPSPNATADRRSLGAGGYPDQSDSQPGPRDPDQFRPAHPLPGGRRRFQNQLWVHIGLFAATLLLTTIVGSLHYAAFQSEFGRVPVVYSSRLLWHGFWYSGTLLLILGAHEMGHYLFCRRYNVDATLPYFIPAPLMLTGTLGAVIRIREPFPTRTILFDIGVAGPLAGFAVLIPALFLGMSMSNVVPLPSQGSGFSLGEPLLFQWATRLMFPNVPDGHTLNMHPMVFAAWFGMLATALNLLPFGQLDGGHITYAVFGRRSTPISIATVATAIGMTFVSSSWFVMTGMMLAMLFFLGPHHPRVLYEYEPLDRQRRIIAIVALIVLILCFTPVPIEPYDLIRNP